LSSPNNPKFPTTTLLLMHIDVTNVVEITTEAAEEEEDPETLSSKKLPTSLSLWGFRIHTLN
jgi:hypothetical protein